MPCSKSVPEPCIAMQLYQAHRPPVVYIGIFSLFVGLATFFFLKKSFKCCSLVCIFQGFHTTYYRNSTVKPDNQHTAKSGHYQYLQLSFPPLSPSKPLFYPSVFMISLPHFQNHLQLSILVMTFFYDEYFPNIKPTCKYLAYLLCLFSFKLRL